MLTDITIAILAGGQSTRMGTDKASLTIDGETLLARIVAQALSTGRRTLVVGRMRPDDWPLTDIPFIPDAGVGHGPIGGLAAALEFVNRPIGPVRPELGAVLAIACDMPLLTSRAFDWLATEAITRQPEFGLAVTDDGQLEPLFSVYCASILPFALERIAEGRRSLHGLIAALAFDHVDAPDAIRPELVNINTAEEWRAVFGTE